MIYLFKTSQQKNKEPKEALFIPTPLGNVHLEVIMGKSKLSETSPQISVQISSHASIYSWSFANLHIELLKAHVDPLLPSHLKIKNCIAFLWRYKILSEKLDLKFNCRISFKEEKLEAEPESGERLFAQSWNNGYTKLTIGTEDEENLLARAETQDWLPLRLAQENRLIPDLITYLEDGIQIVFPTFLQNEEGQAQFIVAWAEPDLNDYSTWYAVDMPYDKILKFSITN